VNRGKSRHRMQKLHVGEGLFDSQMSNLSPFVGSARLSRVSCIPSPLIIILRFPVLTYKLGVFELGLLYFLNFLQHSGFSITLNLKKLPYHIINMQTLQKILLRVCICGLFWNLRIFRRRKVLAVRAHGKWEFANWSGCPLHLFVGVCEGRPATSFEPF
jgi:hypothetical protein